MKHKEKEKYNVAWFKLAEFVSRGERERALGIFRLLVHTLDDQALVHQLAGDLLLSFSDEQALEKYKEAAFLYAQQNKLIEAASVGEHLVMLRPDNVTYAQQVIELYHRLGNQQKMKQYAEHLITCWAEQDDCAALLKAMDEWSTWFAVDAMRALYEKAVAGWWQTQSDEERTTQIAQACSQWLIEQTDTTQLNIWLKWLASTHAAIARNVEEVLQKAE